MNDTIYKQLNGCCPFCGNNVNIVEGMVYEYELNDDGYPNHLDAEHYKVGCYCKHCNRQLYVFPNNNGGYTIYPLNPLNSMYQFNNFSSSKRLSIISNKILSSTDEGINPFTNVVEYNNSLEDLSHEEEKEIEEDIIPF